jgi:hypothetical protein
VVGAARIHRLRVRGDEDVPGVVRELTRDRPAVLVHLPFVGAAVAVGSSLDDDVLGRERRDAREPRIERGDSLGRLDHPDQFRPLFRLHGRDGVHRLGLQLLALADPADATSHPRPTDECERQADEEKPTEDDTDGRCYHRATPSPSGVVPPAGGVGGDGEGDGATAGVIRESREWVGKTVRGRRGGRPWQGRTAATSATAPR